MPKPLLVSIPHTLGRAEAGRRIRDGLGQLLGAFGATLTVERQEWTGDRLDFRVRALGQAVSGRVDVEDEAVRLEIELPFFLHLAAEKARGMIQRQGTLLLEKK